MAGTQLLRQIVIDYTPQNCKHHIGSNTITNTFDHRGWGTCWHSPTRYLYGTFSARIRCPPGNTSGLNFNFYLSTLESPQEAQDEIDFEILGNNMRVVHTNYYRGGEGKRERLHDLGFNSSEGFHKYEINWSENQIEWSVDDRVVRTKRSNISNRPMYVYASIWDASNIDEGNWAGTYVGCDTPYHCVYRDVHVPAGNAV